MKLWQIGPWSTHVLCGLVVYDQSSLFLIEHAMEHLVQDHLTQPTVCVFLSAVVPFRRVRSKACLGHSLGLNARYGLTDFLCHVSEVDYRIRFQDPDQVLLEERVVQVSQMSPDELIML